MWVGEPIEVPIVHRKIANITARVDPMLPLTIIVPTYREAENLALLVPRIDKILKAAGIEYELIVVDDDSPDTTQLLCDRLGLTYPLRLIVRHGQRDLSSAVIVGMRNAKGEILLCMDADLSHPPEKIPEVVSQLADPNVDFVIGSRYASGGQIAHGWSLLRQLTSRVATWLAKPLTTVKDPMAGFFALRKVDFDRVMDQLDPIGYKIGLELLVKTGSQCVVEVPITFHDRFYGESKLGWREQWKYLRHLTRLLGYRHRQKVRTQRLAETYRQRRGHWHNPIDAGTTNPGLPVESRAHSPRRRQ